MRLIICAFAFLLSSTAIAGWSLDNEQSRLHFLSTKKGSITETHHFKKMEGSITDNGQATLSIDLASVATQIPTRDERMGSMLFDVANFPKGTVTLKVNDIAAVKALAVGTSTRQQVIASLNLHGAQQKISADLLVTALIDGKLMIQTLAPIIIRASDFDLIKGIEALRVVANLSSIDLTSPVTFSLIFTP